LPTKGENATVTSRVKTAALCYDRVWCPPENVFEWCEEFPEKTRFFGGTKEEKTISFDIKDKSIKTFPSMKKLFESKEGMELIKKSTLGLMAELMLAPTKEAVIEQLDKAEKIPTLDRDGFLGNTNVIMDLIYRDIAKAFSTKYRIPVATIYESVNNQKIAYSEGDKQVIMACLEEIPIVSEKELSWQQVLEFRADKKTDKNIISFYIGLTKRWWENPKNLLKMEYPKN
jgi:hypothetical protein